MIKTTIEKLAEDIGFEIGASDDVTQSKLLNGFCRGLYNLSTENHNREMQLCFVADKLNTKSCIIIKALADFIKIKEEEQ